MALYKAVRFFNPTSEDFVGKWDGESYEIRAKSSILVPRHIAEHFAKHLANKILQERFNRICSEHQITTTPLTRTCARCKEKSQKLEALYTCPEREPLIQKMVLEEEPEVPPRVASAPEASPSASNPTQ